MTLCPGGHGRRLRELSGLRYDTSKASLATASIRLIQDTRSSGRPRLLRARRAKAEPLLLEPVMAVEIVTPVDYLASASATCTVGEASFAIKSRAAMPP